MWLVIGCSTLGGPGWVRCTVRCCYKVRRVQEIYQTNYNIGWNRYFYVSHLSSWIVSSMRTGFASFLDCSLSFARKSAGKTPARVVLCAFLVFPRGFRFFLKCLFVFVFDFFFSFSRADFRAQERLFAVNIISINDIFFRVSKRNWKSSQPNLKNSKRPVIHEWGLGFKRQVRGSLLTFMNCVDHGFRAILFTLLRYVLLEGWYCVAPKLANSIILLEFLFCQLASFLSATSNFNARNWRREKCPRFVQELATIYNYRCAVNIDVLFGLIFTGAVNTKRWDLLAEFTSLLSQFMHR